MSIINDALKKAQKQDAAGTHGLPHSDGRPHSLRGALDLRLEGRKQGFNWGPLFMLLVLVLITGPILAPIVAIPFKKASAGAAGEQGYQIAVGRVLPAGETVELASLPADTNSSQPDTRQGQFGIEEIPLASLPSQAMMRPDLSLSGVVVARSQDSYCILNGKVVKVGETVLGARVTDINSSAVVLDYQGERISLPIAEA